MLWRTGRLRMVLVTAVTVAGVAALVVFGAGDGFPAARPRLLSGAAWLASSRMGLVTLLDGSAAEVAGQVQVADPGEPIDVVQQAATAYAVNRGTGTIRRIDGATFAVTPAATPIPGARNGLLAFAGDRSLFALDASKGAVTSTDPTTLASPGTPTALASHVDPDAAVLDGAGRLWVLDAATGDLVWIDHGERATRRTRQNAATAGAGQLVLADGAPVVIDTARRRAVLFDGRTGEPGASLGLDLRADDQLRASGSPHSRRIYVATASGVLDICDLAARRCTDVLTLGASGRSDLGVPVEAGGALFVPDYATGTVWVVDLKQPRVLAHPRVLDQPARFQLLAHDGIVFFNDPDSEHAGVVRVDGGVQPVAKYELGHPTGDQPPANPPAAPPPSTPPSRSVPVPPTPATSPSPAPSKAPGAPLAERPALRISVSQSSALVGQEVTLTLVVSGDARPTGVRWSFGDGQGAVGVLTTHRWTAPQTYQITVQATFSSGQPTTASVPFVVTAVPVAMGTLRIVLNGVGTVASRPTGISCPGTCSTTFPVGTVVALTAAPAPTAQFTGWAGPCTGTGACQVTVAPGVTQLDATFAPLPTGDVTPPKISVRPHTTVFHPSNFDKVCGTPTGVGLIADVADAGGVASVWFDYRIATPSPLTGTVQMTPNGPGAYFGGLGSFPVNGNTAAGGAVTVDFHAKDRAGNEAVVTVTDIILKDCPQIR